MGHFRISKHLLFFLNWISKRLKGCLLVDPDDTSAPYLKRNFLLAPVMCVNNVQPFSVALSPLLSRGHLN